MRSFCVISGSESLKSWAMIVVLSKSEMVLLEMRTTSACQNDPFHISPEVAHYLSSFPCIGELKIEMGMVESPKDSISPLNPVLVIYEDGNRLIQKE